MSDGMNANAKVLSLSLSGVSQNPFPPGRSVLLID